MLQPKSLAVTENLQNKQKQQLRPYTNGSLHKLMEVSSSRNSEGRCVASGSDQNICFSTYALGFLGAKWFPKCIILNRDVIGFRSNIQKHITEKF